MKNIKLLFVLSLLTAINYTLYSQTTIYTNDMDYVIGDAKQAFIQNKITTEAQADNLLKGFINQQVNGIRIPIFAQGLNPNKPMFDYFYNIVKKAGIPIFANPAQSSGGQRVACNMLNGATCSVKNDTNRENILIGRIIDFADEYDYCKWINPFNEDGRTGNPWTSAQINRIYATLHSVLKDDMELIGSCTWGIPAGIDVLNNTNIEDYITVSATHNLGFNHGQWSNFINLSKAKGLPVWDSEVNHFDKFGTGTRLEKAIENKVDGLVMYDSWKSISLTNGSISLSGQEEMKLYLKDYTPPTGIALTGTATQSSTNPNFNKEASLAIDGNINGNFGSGSVTVTNFEENPWWQVDLGSEKEIGEIIVFNRTDGCCMASMSNFTVLVLNNAGETVYSKIYDYFPDFAVTANAEGVKGSIVKIQLNLENALTLAEVQVFAPKSALSTENFTKEEVSLYPNPFTDKLTISASNREFQKYCIFNFNGQQVKSGNIDAKQTEINLDNISTGIYFIQLQGNIISKTYKIMKQ